MEIKGCFGKKGMDEIIQRVNEYNEEKKIYFRKTANYDEEDGFSTYQCLYPHGGFDKVDNFSKSEMLYLQEHGFVFKDENVEIVNVETLKN